MDIINNSAQHLSSTIDDLGTFLVMKRKITTFDVNIPLEKVLYFNALEN